MKVLIVEDEKLAAGRLQRILLGIDESIEVVAVKDSVRKAVDFFKTAPELDLAFFDIELADGQSFDIFTLSDVNCPVIFTTAYDEYALRAFKVNSIDYLLKPIDSKQLEGAPEKFKMLSNKNTSSISIEKLIADLKNQVAGEYRSRFLCRQGSKMISINDSDIVFFFAEEKVTFIKTLDGARHIINITLDEVENTVNPQSFFRVNRGMIVQIKSIMEVNTWFNGKIKVKTIPEHTEEVFVSRERAAEFRKWMGE